MANLSNRQIAILYQQIENLDNESIIKMIDEMHLPSFNNSSEKSEIDESIAYGINLPKGKLTSPKLDTKNSLPEICSSYIRKFKVEIWQKVLGKEKLSEFILEVIQIVAPAVAQEYKGVPAMAIVAIITIMCRKGITLYLTGNKTDI